MKPGAREEDIASAPAGWFAHVRDRSGRCRWAFCRSRSRTPVMDFEVLGPGEEDRVSRLDCAHGAGKGQWHYWDQCRLSDQEIWDQEHRPAATPRAAVRHPADAFPGPDMIIFPRPCFWPGPAPIRDAGRRLRPGKLLLVLLAAAALLKLGFWLIGRTAA